MTTGAGAARGGVGSDMIYTAFTGCGSASDWSFYALEYIRLGGEWARRGSSLQRRTLNLLPGCCGSVVRVHSSVPDIFVATRGAVSAVPCGYFLARSYRWERSAAAWFAVALAVHFTLNNQTLSLFYGYHPIVWFIPLGMLFFGFKARGRRKTAGVMLALSLLVQETVAAVWFGYGFMLMFRRGAGCGGRAGVV